VAGAALNNSEITTLYRENRLREVTNWIVLRSSACDNPLNAMRLLHDRIYGQGTGKAFLRGDYLDDLPRAVGERIKVEVLRRIVQNSPEIRSGNARIPDGGGTTLQPISKGTELKVVRVKANDVLNMREEATNDSPVVEFIPPNEEGITSLGECQGQWIFVQYDRAKGWVGTSFRHASRQSRWTYPVIRSKTGWASP
jgi:uncharacterized protein YgiM (DUF1202 family)